MKLSKAKLAILAIIATNIIWGAGPPISKWVLQSVHPMTFAFLRFFLPTLLMLPFMKGKFKVHKKDYVKVLFIGFFGITVNILFFFEGLLQAPSINAALLASSAPVFVILCSLGFVKEKTHKRMLFGALMGLAGVIVVLATPLFKTRNLIAGGNFFFLIATFGSVVAILLVRNVMKRNNPIAITFWSFFIGCLGFLPFFIEEVGKYGFLPNFRAGELFGLIFGVFFSSLIAYFLQTWALKYLTASDVSVFLYIDPIVSILIAAPLLGEFPNDTFLVGAILVFAGIFIAEKRLNYHPIHLLFKK